MPTATLISQESDITAGALKVNDAYDLKLGKDQRVTMKLLFL